jgi:hypothetical protein
LGGKACSLYIRKNETFVVSSALTTHGYYVDRVPVFRVTPDQPDSVIGEAVLRALDSYRENLLPTRPEDRKPDPVLQAMGLKSWGQLERTSRNVSVEENSGSVVVVPTRRPPEGGYNRLDNLALHCLAIADDIGATARKAALLCESNSELEGTTNKT